ncbi:hypothetical protein MMC13_005559 [Lambiella insularis]|nr:hypothetical protein [Lambiella insularis]
MAPYKYKPLNEAAKEIRLMTLFAGPFSSEDIQISLGIKRFLADGSSADPKFEALSYAWGSTDDPARITVHDGALQRRTLAITRNLATALLYLRHEHKDRVLWIDAICVNQHDLAERSHQVQRMADIYTHAELVTAWLGSDRDDSGYALRLLDSLGSRINLDWFTSRITPVSEEDRDWADITKPLPFGEAGYNAIWALFDRPWFERIWIRQ